MNRAHRTRTYAAALALAVITLSGCATSIAGSPVRVSQDATAPSTSGSPGQSTPARPTGPTGPGATTPAVIPTMPPNSGVPDSAVGLKPGVPTADLKVTDDQNTDADNLAKDTIADLITFYTDEFPKEFDTTFVPPAHYESYDSNDKKAAVCSTSAYQEQNAGYYQPPCDTIAWDRGQLLPDMTKQIGALAIPTVLAHEMGHRVQYLLKFDRTANKTLVAEQQADCYAGAYWRWVNDGNSAYFNFNQTAGMTQALTTMLTIRDPLGTDPNQSDPSGQGAHGDAFDRTYAFSLGFADGVKKCSEIDQKSVDARVSESPFSQIPDPKTAGNLSITDSLLSDVAGTVNTFFGQQATGYQAPTLATTLATSCQGSTVSKPVDYCPSTNTVSYDLAELQRIGTPTAGFASYNGDFSAIVLLVSRYGLIAQAAGKSAVTGDNAGLRGLCYAGSWAAWMRNPQGPKKLALSPTDLDKAVYEVINSAVPGSDANGATTSTIFDRLQAFNIGVTTSTDTCNSYYAG